MSASGEAAIVETRRDLRLLPAVANALAHLPASWRINLIHGGQLSPSCVATYLGAPDRLRLRHVREISDVAWRESTNASTHKLRKSPKQWYNNLLASTVFWDGGGSGAAQPSEMICRCVRSYSGRAAWMRK